MASASFAPLPNGARHDFGANDDDEQMRHHAALFRTGSYQHQPNPRAASFRVKSTIEENMGGGGGGGGRRSRRLGGSVRVVRRRPREPEFDFHEDDRCVNNTLIYE